MKAKQRIRAQVMGGRYTDRLPPERDLAAAFGISYMTLRRAIGELVDEGMLRREVGRGTFVCAPGSLGRRTNSIGLILPPHVRQGIANPFYADVFDGAMRACEANGMTLVVATRAQELVPIDGVALHPGRKVDGIIGAAIDPASMPSVLAAARFVPLVLLDSIADKDVPCVLADNVQGSRAATAALVALGHRRIGYVAGALSGVGLERLEGYHLALSEAGIPLDEQLVCMGNFEFGSGQAAGERLFALEQRPTAIACANDTTALGVMRAAQLAGLDIPGDVSLIGFDDIEAAAQINPGLSTVRVPRSALGAAAIRVLAERMADPTAAVLARTVLSTEVILRASTAPPRS